MPLIYKGKDFYLGAFVNLVEYNQNRNLNVVKFFQVFRIFRWFLNNVGYVENDVGIPQGRIYLLHHVFL